MGAKNAPMPADVRPTANLLLLAIAERFELMGGCQPLAGLPALAQGWSMAYQAIWMMTIVGAALTAANPASATSCNTELIDQMTIDDTAKDILTRSSLVGFARIDPGDREEALQQRLEMVFPLKGKTGAVLMKPRTEHNSSQFDRVRGQPGELVFVVLSGTSKSAWMSACMALAVRRFKEVDLFDAIQTAHNGKNGDPPFR